MVTTTTVRGADLRHVASTSATIGTVNFIRRVPANVATTHCTTVAVTRTRVLLLCVLRDQPSGVVRETSCAQCGSRSTAPQGVPPNRSPRRRGGRIGGARPRIIHPPRGGTGAYLSRYRPLEERLNREAHIAAHSSVTAKRRAGELGGRHPDGSSWRRAAAPRPQRQ